MIGMVPKRPLATTSATFDDDDVSLMEVPNFTKASSKKSVRAVDALPSEMTGPSGKKWHLLAFRWRNLRETR